MTSNLFALARSKLSADSKDSFSLHRWVLLKNSIIQPLPSSAQTVSPTPPPDDDDGDYESDAFMFPDGGKLMEGISSEAAASEAAWLDSLLETLGEDDVSVEDDESSETHYCYPFLVPYPPAPSAPSSSLPYVDPLPYCDFDDLEDLPPVPDAIEDTSDDESDAPPTPGHSLSSLDPASIPLPPDHRPHIYIDVHDQGYFHPFDPLPFAHNQPPLEYSQC
ncbi:hypothetical protein C8F01DRAFT_59112 [Mycena amicta]|nr:hypothetical protein C8F01DRAFT_59112 [Mycena amicta]